MPTPLLPNNPGAVFFVSPDQSSASEQQRLEEEAIETDGQNFTFLSSSSDVHISANAADEIYTGFARRRDETHAIDEQFIQYDEQLPEWLTGKLDIERDSSVPSLKDAPADQTEAIREFIDHLKQHAEALLKGINEAAPIRQWLDSIDVLDIQQPPVQDDAPETAPAMSQLEAIDAYWIISAETGDWLMPIGEQDDAPQAERYDDP